MAVTCRMRATPLKRPEARGEGQHQDVAAVGESGQPLPCKKLEGGRKYCANISVSSASLHARSAVVTRANSALWALPVGPILGPRTNAARITVETTHVGELVYPDADFARA